MLIRSGGQLGDPRRQLSVLGGAARSGSIIE